MVTQASVLAIGQKCNSIGPDSARPTASESQDVAIDGADAAGQMSSFINADNLAQSGRSTDTQELRARGFPLYSKLLAETGDLDLVVKQTLQNAWRPITQPPAETLISTAQATHFDMLPPPHQVEVGSSSTAFEGTTAGQRLEAAPLPEAITSPTRASSSTSNEAGTSSSAHNEAGPSVPPPPAQLISTHRRHEWKPEDKLTIWSLMHPGAPTRTEPIVEFPEWRRVYESFRYKLTTNAAFRAYILRLVEADEFSETLKGKIMGLRKAFHPREGTKMSKIVKKQQRKKEKDM